MGSTYGLRSAMLRSSVGSSWSKRVVSENLEQRRRSRLRVRRGCARRNARAWRRRPRARARTARRSADRRRPARVRPSARACRKRETRAPCRATSARSPRALATAVPNPYQPGSIARVCAQPNDHGIARRSSIERCSPRRPGARTDLHLPDLVDRRAGGEEVQKTVAVDQLHVCVRRPFGEPVEQIVPDGRNRLGRLQAAQHRRYGEFQVAPRQRRQAVAGADHLALLGDLEAPVAHLRPAARRSLRARRRRRARPTRRARERSATRCRGLAQRREWPVCAR